MMLQTVKNYASCFCLNVFFYDALEIYFLTKWSCLQHKSHVRLYSCTLTYSQPIFVFRTHKIKIPFPNVFAGILRMYEDILLEMDFIHLAQFLTKLPEDIDAEKLFHSISAIRMTVNKKTFSSVLQQHIDSLSNR